jgi:hypothetical protein
VVSLIITYSTVFGCIKNGRINSKHHLPAVIMFKEWNEFDTESGIKSEMCKQSVPDGPLGLLVQPSEDRKCFFSQEVG